MSIGAWRGAERTIESKRKLTGVYEGSETVRKEKKKEMKWKRGRWMFFHTGQGIGKENIYVRDK